jgi:hypothetical protein
LLNLAITSSLFSLIKLTCSIFMKFVAKVHFFTLNSLV